MQIRFSPPWEVQPNIDKGAAVKSVELLQAGFFNWLYDCPNGFSSIIIPEVSRSAIYKALMAPPVLPGKYYDQVLRLVESGEKVSLDDLYGETIPCRLRWVFTQRGDTIVASFAEAKSGSGFSSGEDHAAKKMFCAELFKYMRTKTRVVDDCFSTSAQFAANEVLTQLYACHLSH